MMQFSRYPHVKDLLLHYVGALKRDDVLDIMNNGIKNEAAAECFGLFVWSMADAMAVDEENEKVVLGRVDNFDLLADVEYEVSLNMGQAGFARVWDKICDGG